MTSQTITVKRAKRMARTLHDALKESRPKSYSGCLETVSRMLGFDGFNALQAELPDSEADLPAAGGTLASASQDDLLAELGRRGLLVTRSLDIEEVLADYPILDRSDIPAIREELRQAFHFTETAEACANLEHSVLADVQAQTSIRIGPDTDGPVGCALVQILDTEDAVTDLLDADPTRRAVHVSLDAAGTLRISITRRDRSGQTTIEMLTDADTRRQIGMLEDLDGIRDTLNLDTLGLVAMHGPTGIMLLLFEDRPEGLVQRALVVRPLQVDDDGELFAGMPDPSEARAALAAMPEDDRLFSIAGLLDDATQNTHKPVCRPVHETSIRMPYCRGLAESAFRQSPEWLAVRVRAVLGEPYLDALQPDGNGGYVWQAAELRFYADSDRLVREIRRVAIALAMQAGSLAIVITRDPDACYLLDDPQRPSRVWRVDGAEDGTFEARLRPLLLAELENAREPAREHAG
ncbi:hypothetical protein CKO28_20520 [Rhodovibrio sodomensis]|uniref:Uncharacterized protein n=1 Tax=Rhodovibrio sodomensis TaxID=1088 RepID=A0ABS1DJZ5_9PROT|nr:hypothetical protein [Rhodovibrio sodomensis]MBK1670412.1 hypothetical protein [Rhodovibrio sodomensis]